MTTEILKLEHNSTKTRPTYGGMTTEVEYTLTTFCENHKNVYEITAEVRGIPTASLYLQIWGVKSLTNNEHTLTAEAIEDLLGW